MPVNASLRCPHAVGYSYFAQGFCLFVFYVFLLKLPTLDFFKDHWLIFFPQSFSLCHSAFEQWNRHLEERRREKAFQERKYLQSNITARLRPFNSPHLLSLRCSFLQGGEFGQITAFQKICYHTNNSKISSNSKFDVHVSWDRTEMLFRCCLPEIKMNKTTEKIAARPENEGQKPPRHWRLKPTSNHWIWCCPITTTQKGK